MLRTCTRCKKEQPEDNFNWKIKGKQLSVHCKDCSKAYLKSHYKRNRDYYLSKAKKRNYEVRNQSRKYLWDFLKVHPCVDCGETDIVVLEFDHKNRNSKTGDVSLIIAKSSSLDRLIREVAMCEVRCANCHRRKTAQENNNWKINMHP